MTRSDENADRATMATRNSDDSERPRHTTPTRPQGVHVVCWLLVVLWYAAMVAATTNMGTQRGAVAEVLQSAALAAFVLLHVGWSYSGKGLICYVAVAGLVSFAMEASSVTTGFPFGFYTHHVAGPRVMDVPVAVVAGWVTLTWLAWVLAQLTVGSIPARTRSLSRFAVPIVAALLLGGWDLVYDPIASTVRGLYSYASPSGASGVPLSNYLGWIVTGWAIFQLFSMVELRWRRPGNPARARRGFHLAACLIWFGFAVQIQIEFACSRGATLTHGNQSVSVASIYESSAATALFTLTLVAVLAIIRNFSGSAGVADRRPVAQLLTTTIRRSDDPER